MVIEDIAPHAHGALTVFLLQLGEFTHNQPVVLCFLRLKSGDPLGGQPRSQHFVHFNVVNDVFLHFKSVNFA